MTILSLEHLCWKEHYLEVEPGTFGHEGERHNSTNTGQGTDDHKHPPAVELVC